MAEPTALPEDMPHDLKRDLYNGWRRHRTLDVMIYIEEGLTLRNSRIASAFIAWLSTKTPRPPTGWDYLDGTYAQFRQEVGGALPA